VRKLEARFHLPTGETGEYVVVGHVVWDPISNGSGVRVEPADSLAGACSPATLLATLKHLVRMTAPKSFERLVGLRSRHWSFIERESPR
jgi:hypothetical protein